MSNKERYEIFCEKTYIPIYSKAWWMDAVCGRDNWNVWLYEKGTDILAAMPYYIEQRGEYKYITKAPLTQNNGIIFYYPKNMKESSKGSYEEKIINEACNYIKYLNVDVYEQQYQTTFTNWSPFFWNQYQSIVRYTYVFDKKQLEDTETIWEGIDKKKRNRIKKGEANCSILKDLPPDVFYNEVEKVYNKQNLKCPFSPKLWDRLYKAVMEHNSGHIIYAINQDGIILSTKFLVWDDNTMYALISGGDIEYQNLETKSALDWYAIKDAAQKGLNYDFEGSMIKRIAKVYREFGALPKPYYRIRKVFNTDIIMQETIEKIKEIEKESGFDTKI